MYFDQSNLPNENYFHTMYARLHVFDGSGLENYRMVYESNETHYDIFGKPARNIKIFEYVKGAKIAGKVSHKETVSLSGTIITNQRRMFEYAQQVKADEKGDFEFTVPYSIDDPYETRLLKSYELIYGNSSRSVPVSENDILNGYKILAER